MFFRTVYKSGQMFLPFCQGSRVWRTDRQTDGRTDGRTEISSQYRVYITCSAVKAIASSLMESVFAYILTTDKAIIMKLRRNIKQEKYYIMLYNYGTKGAW